MVTILFKWLLIGGLASNAFSPVSNLGGRHPYFVSVTEIEHNAKEQSLQISCKIFTDDFEKALRKNCNCPVDLLQPAQKQAMDKLVINYIQKHLLLKINNNKIALKYLGYEQIEEGIYSYWEVDNIATVNNIEITDNILYEYKKEQANIVHVTVQGKRKSSKLNNPNDKVSFRF
jgi:hypothetical protein